MMSQPYNDHQLEPLGWNVDATSGPVVVAPRPGAAAPQEPFKATRKHGHGQGRGDGRSAQESTTTSTFPFRLHEMLNDAEEKRFDHIISWQGPHGFIIHDRGLLEKQVLPQYYLQTRYKSFTRQRKFVNTATQAPVASDE